MQAFDAMVHLYLPTKDFHLWAVRIFMNRDTEVEIPGFNHMFSVADLLKEHNIPVKTDFARTTLLVYTLIRRLPDSSSYTTFEHKTHASF
jgi:hypothetical protein